MIGHPQTPSTKNKILIRFWDRLGVRHALFYTILLFFALSATAWIYFYTAKKTLDNELGKKLMGIAKLVSHSVDSDSILLLRPGDEGTPLHRIWVKRLQEIQASMGLRDIFIFDLHLHLLLDADQEIAIGEEYRLLAMDTNEIQRVREGHFSTSTLYQGNDGAFYKTGYAPLYDSQGKIVAGIGVESGAAFLSQMNALKRQMILIALLSILITVTLSILFSRSILRPIDRLLEAMSRASESGTLETVPVTGRNEFGFLGHKFNEMVENLADQDQTLRKLYAMEKERSAIIQRLSAGLAHEIRNPLGAMIGYAELLERHLAAPRISTNAIDSKTQGLLDGMKEEIRVLNRIMTDFLSFARKSRLQTEKVSIPSLLHRTVTAAIASGAISGNVLAPSTIQVQYDLDPDLPEIYADPVEIRRALFNILQNAADAMPEGGIVAIHARVTENGHGVELQISDTGAGIHEKDLEKIFHPFYTTKTAGTGLGLAISRKIIEEHGGTVFVQSREGKGTTFAIALPLLPPIAPYAASMEPLHEVTKT